MFHLSVKKINKIYYSILNYSHKDKLEKQENYVLLRVCKRPVCT